MCTALLVPEQIHEMCLPTHHNQSQVMLTHSGVTAQMFFGTEIIS